jgi:hypothetical protein
MRTRLLEELRRAPARAVVDAALASVAVRVEDGTAIVSRGAGVPLFGSERTEARARATIAPGVYAQTPTSDARVRLLVAAASIAERIEVHAPLTTDGTWRGRLVFDLPRRVARAAGLPAAEPGDRFAGAYAHAFFDDELLIDEARRAGLVFVARRGAWILLDRGGGDEDGRAEHPRSFPSEVVRALRTIREAERQRQRAPADAVSVMRERGRSARARGPIGRARLERAIGWVDAAFPGGPNCFRRVLAVIALDGGAAADPLVFGLDVGRTGHVAFKGTEDRVFDVAFEI